MFPHFSGETMSIKEQVSLPTQGVCSRCNFVSSQKVCKACVLLEGLNKGLPKLGIGKSSKVKKILAEYDLKQAQENKPSGSLADAVKDLEIDDTTSLTKGAKSRKSKKKVNENGVLKERNKCQKNNCCSGKCSNTEKAVENSKINTLLKEYGLDEVCSGQVTHGINSEENNAELLVNDDEDTCGGGCGNMGSLQIGF